MKKAFTLAETMTVLMLIGVVAAFTLPVLNVSVSERKDIAIISKLYSSFGNNIQTILSANACYSISCLRRYKLVAHSIGHNGVFSDSKYFMVVGSCNNCITAASKMPIPEMQDYSVYRLSNGAAMALYDFNGNCNTTGYVSAAKESYEDVEAPGDGVRRMRVKTWSNIPLCGVVVFDINAEKGPNIPGKDRFAYYIADEPVDNSYLVPIGYTADDDSVARDNQTGYNRGGLVRSQIGGDVGCVVGNREHLEYGYNCTAKIMIDGWKIKY